MRIHIPRAGVVVAVLAFSAGSITGSLLTLRYSEKKYKQHFEAELERTLEFYRKLYKKDQYADPKDVLIRQATEEDEGFVEAVAALRTYRDGVPILEEGEEVTVREPIKSENISDGWIKTDDHEAGWDYDEEIARRSPGAPYIIHHDEFFEGEKDYLQSSLVYYEGDDVLSDERDKHIDDVEGTIGSDNLRFGHGSRDNNIVYIRNDRLEMDFEVMRSFGKYSQEVLGFIEHSDNRGPRKFRDYD